VKDKDRRPKGKAAPATSSRGVQGRAVQAPVSRAPQSKPPQSKHQAPRSGDDRPAAKAAPEKDASKPAASEPAPRAEVRIRTGAKPDERIPIILETKGARDYHLIDSGTGLKLEQYGPYRIVRPEAQAIWPKALPSHVWERADSIFTGDTDEEGIGRWRFPKTAARRDLADEA
jgi:23S rRNA (cytosine1962-C5)-methyltransferase